MLHWGFGVGHLSVLAFSFDLQIVIVNLPRSQNYSVDYAWPWWVPGISQRAADYITATGLETLPFWRMLLYFSLLGIIWDIFLYIYFGLYFLVFLGKKKKRQHALLAPYKWITSGCAYWCLSDFKSYESKMSFFVSLQTTLKVLSPC